MVQRPTWATQTKERHTQRVYLSLKGSIEMGALLSVAREVREPYGGKIARSPLRVVDPARAHEELVSLARRRAADDVAMLEPLLVAHGGRVHETLGLGSFQEYCSRLFGWCGRTTRERLRVARAMRSLPEMRARWVAGELTYSVVRELTRVATPEVEAEWLTWATGEGVRRTVREVAQMVSRHSAGARPSDAPAPFEERTVTVVLRMSGSEATRYSEARAEATRRIGHSVDDETFAKMLLDAFLRGGATEGDPGRAPNQVRMTVCERCGATERQAGAEGSVPVHAKVGETALCDAQVLRGGERATQTVPPTVRREILQRDQGKCAVPGCSHASFVDVHHVTRRADGGTHDPSNLVSLCSVHHGAAHEGLLVIRPGEQPASFHFERADGRAYGTITTELSSCSAAADDFVSATMRTGNETRARLEVDQQRSTAAHVGQGTEARPAIRVPLVEQVVGLLTSMGFKKHESRALVERAIAGGELPEDRCPTTVELLRASLRANVLHD